MLLRLAIEVLRIAPGALGYPSFELWCDDLEGAPHLKPQHLAVFDCANPCGRTGRRDFQMARRWPKKHTIWPPFAASRLASYR